MRPLSFLIIVTIFAYCNSSKKMQTNAYDLNGVWIPVKQEMNGKELPSTVYQNFKLTMADSNFIFGIGEEDKGTISYKNGKMDIYGKEGVNKGKHYTAIYKLENGLLTICYNLAGDGYPEAFETKSKPTLFLTEYKKQ